MAGPVLPRLEFKGACPVPYVLSDGDTLLFEGQGEAETLTILGCVSVSKGYPLFGEYGEPAAEVVVEYTDGSRDTFMLRNGKEITTAFSSLGSSRIDPICENASRFAVFHYDKNFENYIINRLDCKLSERKTAARVIFRSLSNGYDILVYGVLA